MKKSTTNGIEYAADWQNQNVKHFARYHLDRIDFWSDIFSGRLGDTSGEQAVDTTCIENFAARDILPEFSSNKFHKKEPKYFKTPFYDPVVAAWGWVKD